MGVSGGGARGLEEGGRKRDQQGYRYCYQTAESMMITPHRSGGCCGGELSQHRRWMGIGGTCLQSGTQSRLTLKLFSFPAAVLHISSF